MKSRRKNVGTALALGALVTALLQATLSPAALAAAGDCDATTPAVASPATGLTNVGFETGMAPWREGAVVDSVGRTDATNFTAPYEGQWMGQLGTPAADSSVSQTPGLNEICQDFVVDSAQEAFVYNFFTYDYTGFDDFRFALTVTDPDTDQILASYEQGAFGSGTALKTTGWKGIELNLAGHMGETLRLTVSAGGTSDSLYAFWGYIDSAVNGLPPTVAAAGGAGTASGSGSVTKDPQTGEITISMPNSNAEAVTFVAIVECPDGNPPLSAPFLQVQGGSPITMTEDPTVGPAAWSAVIPAGQSGQITITAPCSDQQWVNTVGQIVLYDPSGLLTDSVTGLPVVAAKVTLYVVPGWTARATSADNATPNTCESNTSKVPGAAWAQPAPTDQGQVANPYQDPPIMSPQVNPFISNEIGYYGWDVAAGCYYVVVTHSGYQTLTSPVVGVPPEVLDLDLVLTPKTVSGLNGSAASTPFIKKLVAAGFSSGCSSTATTIDYCKDNPVNRADMAIFLSRGVGGESFLQPYKGTFGDVPEGLYYTPWVERLADSGVTSGCSVTPPLYCPSSSVTREQMAVFLLKAAGVQESALLPYAGTYADVPESSIFARWIEELGRRGITSGCGTDPVSGKPNYCPSVSVTREQMAIFLVRVFLPTP